MAKPLTFRQKAALKIAQKKSAAKRKLKQGKQKLSTARAKARGLKVKAQLKSMAVKKKAGQLKKKAGNKMSTARTKARNLKRKGLANAKTAIRTVDNKAGKLAKKVGNKASSIRGKARIAKVKATNKINSTSRKLSKRAGVAGKKAGNIKSTVKFKAKAGVRRASSIAAKGKAAAKPMVAKGVNRVMAAKTKARNKLEMVNNAMLTKSRVGQAKTGIGKLYQKAEGANRALSINNANKRRTMATKLANTRRLTSATAKPAAKAPASSPYQPKKKKPGRRDGRKRT